MAEIYKPKITEGAAEGFNPKCNQASGAQFAATSIPSTADVAEQATRRRAAERVSQEAYEQAKQAQRRRAQNNPKRWLSHDDLA